MEIVLRDNIAHLGKAGDVVRVKDGYARNYLLPKGLAYLATEANKRRFAHEAEALAKRRAAEKADAELVATKLAEVTLTFRVKVGDEDKLYGSVTAAHIHHELEALGWELEKRKIALPEPIRELGDYTVPIRLHPDVKPEVRVSVVKEE